VDIPCAAGTAMGLVDFYQWVLGGHV
jgi:hypothetical protein